MLNSQKAKDLAPMILRLGLTTVFIWFGLNQLLHTAAWVGFVPGWATNIFGLASATLVKFNGTFEIIAALLLGAGVYVRFVAGLLALHLFVIATSLGVTAIGVRDFGLSFATLAVAFFGNDQYCLSYQKHSD